MPDPTAPTGSIAVFVAEDLAASLDSYENDLGFEIDSTWGEPATYAGVCRGQVALHLQSASVTERPAGTSCLNVYVGSADAVHPELVDGGARVQKAPATDPYGVRDFDVHDLDGNVLGFGHVEAPAANA
jgi:uncharacterized glyoxalase superfamily protein PhnB